MATETANIGAFQLEKQAEVGVAGASALGRMGANGTATGPFDMAALAQMVAAGQLTRDSLVWKPGMPEWSAARSVAELSCLFAAGGASGIPPVPVG